MKVSRVLGLGLVVAVIIVAIVAALYLAGRPDPGPEPELTAATPVPEPTPTTAPSEQTEVTETGSDQLDTEFEACLAGVCEYFERLPESGSTITMIDASDQVNWSVPTEACLADLETFLVDQELLVDAYVFRLIDILEDVHGPVSYQLPPSDDPVNEPSPNEGSAKCAWSEADEQETINCDVSVTRHEHGMTAEVRAAVLLATMDGIRRTWYEDRLGELQHFYHEDVLEQFQPVVSVPEPDQYQMACWELTANWNSS